VQTGLAVELDDPLGNRLGITDCTTMPQHGGLYW
jgi:hypothetical protein